MILYAEFEFILVWKMAKNLHIKVFNQSTTDFVPIF
jgi:hypothetical protein